MMPEMDGFEVCRQLQKDERTRDIDYLRQYLGRYSGQNQGFFFGRR